MGSSSSREGDEEEDGLAYAEEGLPPSIITEHQRKAIKHLEKGNLTVCLVQKRLITSCLSLTS
jgi:hypothetical protein